MKLSDTEWSVMKILWEKSPASVRDVHEQVHEETEWAYTTVKTILDRLVDKGAVKFRRRANSRLFEPLISKGQARKHALQSLVEKAFDGTFGSLFQHMVSEEKLSKKDRLKLVEMLDQKRSSREKSSKEKSR